MGLGLKSQIFKLAADQPVTNSVALVTLTGLSAVVSVSQIIFWEFFANFTLGATGGFRFQPTGPAGITHIVSQWSAAEATTPASFFAGPVTQTPFTNAAAVAATYIVKGSGSFTVGATAGTLAMQFAQNNATGNAKTVLAGAILRVTIL